MKIILSCTTTYERRDLFYYGIQSLLKQSLQPDLFLVNISKKSFLEEVGKSELPEWLQREEITVNDVEDIGPYTKLIPALDYADENDFIVTVDDDVLYGVHLIENLVSAKKKEPNSIVCSRAKRIVKNILNTTKNYGHWRPITHQIKGHDILPLGVGGVVYQKKMLDLDFLCDHKFLDIAPTTDDLWFRMASLRKQVPVAVYPKIEDDNIYLEHKKGLVQYNLDKRNKGSTFVRGKNFLRKEIQDYLGIKRTANDNSWERVKNYSQEV